MIGMGKIAHPGTFNANPLSAAAGKTALAIVASEPIGETADALAQRLKDGLNDTLVKLEVPGCAYGVSSVVRMRLGVDHACDREFCAEGEHAGVGYGGNVIQTLDQALINEGVYSKSTQWALSATHTDELVDQTLSAFERALKQVRSEAGI
jgi:glutamate-1-semialdehyde 2,1-aminomutase